MKLRSWLLLALLLASAPFVVGCAPDAGEFMQEAPVSSTSIPLPTSEPTPDPVQLGAEVYAANCANCHGANLEGQPNWQSTNADGTWRSPPHDETGHTWHHPDAYLLERIRNGTASLDPQMQTLSNMPAYANILTDNEIDAVLAFIKDSWSPDIKARQAATNQ